MPQFIAVLMLLLTASLSFADSRNESLNRRVNEFCATEFNGDQANRVLFFSPQIREKNAVNFVIDPVYLVDTFKVVSIAMKGDSADVVVEYGLSAKFQNAVYHNYPGRRPDPAVVLNLADILIIQRKPKFRQKLVWKFNAADQEWYLVSTQLPKVSKGAMLQLLRAEVRRETATLADNPGKALPDLEGLRTWHFGKIDLIIRNLGEGIVEP